MKRIFDLVVTFFGLPLLLPVITLTALILISKLGLPIFFKQSRPGLNRKIFNIYKFRTMTNECDKDGILLSDEARLTKFGKFLRSTSLDELPTLWNVLKSDMSLVGPRPERPVFVEDFKKTIPKYMLRLKMKAGLTGWAQINGWRGNTSLEKRIEYDLYYINHWSIFMDLKIILLTFWKGFLNPHAY